MASGKTIAATLIAMTIVAVFFTPLADITNANTGTVEQVDNVTADVGNYVDIQGYDITTNFTAYNNSGTQLTEGTDYELNQTAGTILIKSGSANVADGESVGMVYEYEATDATTGTIAGMIPMFAGLLLIGVAAARMRKMM